MDPLFWIASGVVVGCIIMIPILWRLEVQAERRAAGRKKTAEESAEVKAVDPRAVLEEMETRPIPIARAERLTPTPPPEPSLSDGPADEAPRDRPTERAASNPAPAANTLPLPGVQIRPKPAAASTERAGQEQAIQAKGSHPARAPDQPDEPAQPSVPPPDQLDKQAQTSETRPSADQPTQKLPTNPQVSLNGRQDREPPRPAPTTRPLPAQRAPEPAAEAPTLEAQTAAPPNPPKASGFRRHSLARVEPAGAHQPAPGAPGTPETST